MSRSYKFSPLQQQIASALEEAREEDIVCLACTLYPTGGVADPAEFLVALRHGLEWLQRLNCVAFVNKLGEPGRAAAVDDVLSAIGWDLQRKRFVAANPTAPLPTITLTDQGYEMFFKQ